MTSLIDSELSNCDNAMMVLATGRKDFIKSPNCALKFLNIDGQVRLVAFSCRNY